MTPPLNGRLQTRGLVLGVFGLLVAAVLTRYRMTLSILAAVVLAGIGWESLYHFLQQFRWEKDWPTLFGLLTIVNEGLLMGLLVYRTTVVVPRDLRPSALAFTIDFVFTWLAFWLFVNGPIRVLLPRWRFNGGRIV